MRTVGFALVLVFGLVLLAAAPAAAQTSPSSTTNMEILAQKLKADKKLVVAEAMGLTDAEAKGFWPIYDAYQADLQKINNRLKTGIENYAKDYNAGTMTDAKAADLTKEMIAIDEGLTSLKKTYVEKLNGVIPAVKIARYVQIENKIRALVNYQLADGIPLVPLVK